MSFSKLLDKKVQLRTQSSEPGAKDCISLYELLRAAKSQHPHATYSDIASTFIKLLSNQSRLRFFILKKDKIIDVSQINFQRGLEYESKKGTLKFEDMGRYHSITPNGILIGVDDSLSKESLRTHGFLRTQIAPLIDFTLPDVMEDEPDWKSKYEQLEAKQNARTIPPLSGEIYAIKREEVLMAALAILQQRQKSHNKVVIPTITELLNTLEEKAALFWPITEKLPLARKNASELIGLALNLLDRPNPDIECLREEKKLKRKSIEKERVEKGQG